MRLTQLATSALALTLGLGGVQAIVAQPGPPPGYGQDRWDAPPREFNQAQRQGYIDGIDGAQKDFGNHRRPDPNNRWEYTHPHLPQEMWEAYRDGFRRGYDRAMAHLMGAQYRSQYPVYQPAPAPPPPVYQPQGPGYGHPGEAWEAAPSEFNELQRRGFHDGIEGARKDYGNHRAPDVNNRDEYRHPDLNGPDRRVYREAFRRGYQMAASHLWGTGQHY
jgi:hypothetical protein